MTNQTRHTILIVGCGGIGLRHLQSCSKLSEKEYQIIVVDPSEMALNKAKCLINEQSPYHNVRWLTSLDQIVDQVSIAIVATTSDVRAKIVLELISHFGVTNFLLEKVLFNSLDDYASVSDAITNHGIKAYVNCVMRLYEPFRSLRNMQAKNGWKKMTVYAPGDDFGCNGIHYLDLASYFFDTEDVVNQKLSVEKLTDAKRAGFLKIAGNAVFHFNGQQTLEISCLDGKYNGIEFRFADEMANEIGVLWRDGFLTIKTDGLKLQKTYSIPKQSELTATIVENIIAGRDTGLSLYANSHLLHISLLNAVIATLPDKQAKFGSRLCPIT